MKKINLVTLFLLALFISSTSYSQIKIKYKIGNEIVTNIDILNEKNYLIFLRPDLVKLSNNELMNISENSLIREIIKKKELNKIFGNINKLELEEEIKKNLFNYKNVKNKDELITLMNKHNIKYKNVISKIKYEGLWNELIFKKYGSLVNVNKEKLRKDLIKKISSAKKYEYRLSEILFEVNKNETFKQKYNEILKYAKINDFKSAATKYSISNSSNKGGQIGWIKETMLSEELIEKLERTKIGQITVPTKYPNGYLILMINEKKEMKQIINIEEELKDIVQFEKNKQLNQFSLLFFKKLKQNTTINEY